MARKVWLYNVRFLFRLDRSTKEIFKVAEIRKSVVIKSSKKSSIYHWWKISGLLENLYLFFYELYFLIYGKSEELLCLELD